jgi:hypothetical protein
MSCVLSFFAAAALEETKEEEMQNSEEPPADEEAAGQDSGPLQAGAATPIDDETQVRIIFPASSGIGRFMWAVPER